MIETMVPDRVDITTVSPLSVANSVLYKMAELGKEVRPMKLQKMLYYTVGFHHKIYANFIIEKDFYKWDYGPVVPSVYEVFYRFKHRVINKLGENEKGEQLIVSLDNLIFYSTLNDIILYYGDLPDYFLSTKTHDHNCWIDSAMYQPIPKEHVKLTFRDLNYGE